MKTGVEEEQGCRALEGSKNPREHLQKMVREACPKYLTWDLCHPTCETTANHRGTRGPIKGSIVPIIS